MRSQKWSGGARSEPGEPEVKRGCQKRFRTHTYILYIESLSCLTVFCFLYSYLTFWLLNIKSLFRKFSHIELLAMSRSWNHKLFDCFNLSAHVSLWDYYKNCTLIQITLDCLTIWCPCILYGKTQARRDGNSDASFCNDSVRILSWLLPSVYGLLRPLALLSPRNSPNDQPKQYAPPIWHQE